MESCLREQVKAALDIDNIPNAIFICERLNACRPSEENKILLAKCYVRNRQDFRAVHLLKKRGNRLPMPGRLLLAQATYRMDNHVEAENVITAALHTDFTDKYMRAEFHYLLGMICRKTNRTDSAAGHFVDALECNPLLWPAFEELCKYGKSAEMKRHFEKLKGCMKGQNREIEISEAPAEQTATSRNAAIAEDVEMIVDEVEERTLPPLCLTPLRTQTRSSSSVSGRREQTPHTPPALIRPVFDGAVTSNSNMNRPATRHSMRLRENTVSRRRPTNRVTPDRPVVEDPAGPTPSKTDDFPASDSVYYSAEDAQSETHSTPKRPLTSAVELDDNSSMSIESENPMDYHGAANGLEHMYKLFYLLSKAVYELSVYNHDQALQIFTTSLPGKQADTAWVLSKIGCLHMQRANYDAAKKMFLEARASDPTHFEDMDVFSSMLYLMNETAQLTHLATELREKDRLAPETWCVVGNLHSLLREHSNALSAFHRAIQLDSHRSYSYSLCGHTYLEMEDFEKALICFRQAVALDKRHQSGWCNNRGDVFCAWRIFECRHGMGMVHFLTQKYTEAVADFQKAVKINPSHSVFRLRHGITLAKLGKSEEAIAEFEMATKLDKHNKDAFLHKGKLHYDMGQFQLAKTSFTGAVRVAHLDAEVHFHLGLACKKLGDTHGATEALYRALDLNPGSIVKANIRAALDKINQPDDDQLRKY